MDRQPQPLRFFVKGIIGLIVLFSITLLMAERPEVLAVRGMIVVGLLVIALKMVLRYFNIDWPRRRG